MNKRVLENIRRLLEIKCLSRIEVMTEAHSPSGQRFCVVYLMEQRNPYGEWYHGQVSHFGTLGSIEVIYCFEGVRGSSPVAIYLSRLNKEVFFLDETSANIEYLRSLNIMPHEELEDRRLRALFEDNER